MALLFIKRAIGFGIIGKKKILSPEKNMLSLILYSYTLR